MTYSVRDEPDYAPTYTEDEQVTIRKGDLRALLDITTGSMDFGSGFLTEEDVEAMRAIAVILDVDPALVTQGNFKCKYEGHEWVHVATSEEYQSQRRWYEDVDCIPWFDEWSWICHSGCGGKSKSTERPPDFGYADVDVD